MDKAKGVLSILMFVGLISIIVFASAGFISWADGATEWMNFFVGIAANSLFHLFVVLIISASLNPENWS